MPLFPVGTLRSSPANLRCASGAKKKDVGNDKVKNLSHTLSLFHYPINRNADCKRFYFLNFAN
ncbi:MAG: hypothetical protein SF097_05415, partial [Acidobacteriota bacterium]|nr:hypothetical protein [Acidobacteriota bacterium]